MTVSGEGWRTATFHQDPSRTTGTTPSEESVDEGGNVLRKRLLIMSVVLAVSLLAALPAVAQVTTTSSAFATEGSALRGDVESFGFAAQAEYCRGGYDSDGDGIPNRCDPDADDDGIQNGADNDIDGDGTNNGDDRDVDGDRKPNRADRNVDGDIYSNRSDPDIDGDGFGNCNDSDMDGDGKRNGRDRDRDGDGVPNHRDNRPSGPARC
jgi:hypothetical protein